MHNICRPFVLYNDFLPPGQEVHDEWDYLAFGYYDGISVGDNLFQEGNCSLELLWEYEKGKLRALRGKYSEKIVFGFRTEDEEEDIGKDEKFWVKAKENNVEYPFVFVTLLQMKSDQVPDMHNRKKLEKELSTGGKSLAISYLTLDNSDMILVLLCRRYKDGTDILDSFHRKESNSPLRKCGLHLTYSFTIAAINRQVLNNNLSEIAGGGEECVRQVYVYIIEKKPGSIDIIRDEMCNVMGLLEGDRDEKIKKESILGCNDEVIVIKDVPWATFLKLFQDRSGVLNNSNRFYNENLIGVTTIIAQAQEGSVLIEKNAGGDGSEGRDVDIPLLSARLRALTGELGNTRDLCAGRFENLSRYLYQIINSLQKFERSLFPDYVFISAFLPLNLVMLISEAVTEKTEDRFFESFYEFIKELNMYVQNATHSDRQFTQTVNFDIRIYSTPVKMNALYNHGKRKLYKLFVNY